VFIEKLWYNERIMRKKYETDLTDEQWAEIEPLFVGMRKRKWEKRELVNAVLYLVRTGCQWRNLPHDFPPAFTVHSFYRRARLSGLWDRILQHLVKITRERSGKNQEPSYAIIDSQSVKTTSHNEKRGYDGGKKQKAENVI
jgi:transposase